MFLFLNIWSPARSPTCVWRVGWGNYRIVMLYNLAGRTTKLEVGFEGLQHLLPLYFLFPLLPVWS